MPATAVERATGRPSVPSQEENREDDLGDVTRESAAEDVWEFHREGLQRKRYRDLTAEKYLIHIDGEGDGQWADILNGQRVAVPPNLSGTPRAQHNLLRPMVDNFIAYHTSMPLRFAVDTKMDRASREQAMIDQALINYIVADQDWNTLFAEALYLAAAYGHCPVHAVWRDDLSDDPYEPVFSQKGELMMKLASKLGLPEEQIKQSLPQKGMIDCFVGDPWDTVYNSGATKNSVQVKSYGRVLPADMVRRAFGHVQGVDKLEGNERMPSASRFQRTMRKWTQDGLDIHGTSAIYGGEGGEELIALVFRETAPGVLPDWPRGRLQIVGLDGASSTDTAETGGQPGRPLLLHDGELPGGCFSSTEVYSHVRADDIHGKPYVADLDDLQVKLNQLETLWNESVRRATRPPFLNTSGLDEDTAIFEDDAMIDIEPGANQFEPGFVEYPTAHLSSLQGAIERTEAAMFRIGGWQAASRGEADSGDSGKKVIVLSRADDTIHAPINKQLKRSQEEFAGICWRLFKQFGDVPWTLDIMGDEVSHLAEPYVDRTKISDEPPRFKVVSGMGATPEAEAEELINLMQVKDPETGEPLLGADEVRARWPDNRTFRSKDSAEKVRERRPRIVNTKIRGMVEDISEKLPPQMSEAPVGHRRVQVIARQLLQRIDQQYPVLRDDDLEAHINALSQLTQDETEHPITRAVAMQRQQMYYRYAAAQQQQQMAARTQAEEQGAETAEQNREAARSMAASAGDEAGTTTSQSLQQAAGGNAFGSRAR